MQFAFKRPNTFNHERKHNVKTYRFHNLKGTSPHFQNTQMAIKSSQNILYNMKWENGRYQQLFMRIKNVIHSSWIFRVFFMATVRIAILFFCSLSQKIQHKTYHQISSPAILGSNVVSGHAHRPRDRGPCFRQPSARTLKRDMNISNFRGDGGVGDLLFSWAHFPKP